DKVVPIDVELGKTFTTLLITGPNTGGKTVSLKTVGLFALMAQAGLFIPALSGSTMPVFQNVYADIGDEQSIEQSLSTFSGHMTNLVRILQDVSSRDLVLIDEIGAGTDPEEGAALAMSILEYLQEIGAATIATTHYSELKTFAYTRPGVENGSVEFDVQTLRPTYRLLIGVPGSSNAFAISKRLGLSDAVIARARQLMSSEHKEFSTVLEELETQRNSYLERAGLIQAKEQEVEVLQRRLQREKNEWQEKKQDLQKKARDEAANLIRQTRREAESLIRELKEQFAVSEEKQRQNKIQQIRKRLQQRTGALIGLEHPAIDADMKPVDLKAVKPGDEVYVATLGKNGNILSVGADDLTVQIGILKMSVSANDCLTSKKSTVKEAKIERKTAVRLNTAQLQGVSRQIDIRGMTIDEAVPTLDKFIDDAVMANLPEVLVIHGKGTGALRKGVRRYLENHPNVQTVKIGEYNEGGDGVSVAVLR
ncbi:MAG: mutS2, partial [Firmicutes bacterium]|nr:mutS2 [Bacillota bacterium]